MCTMQLIQTMSSPSVLRECRHDSDWISSRPPVAERRVIDIERHNWDLATPTDCLNCRSQQFRRQIYQNMEGVRRVMAVFCDDWRDNDADAVPSFVALSVSKNARVQCQSRQSGGALSPPWDRKRSFGRTGPSMTSPRQAMQDEKKRGSQTHKSPIREMRYHFFIQH